MHIMADLNREKAEPATQPVHSLTVGLVVFA